MPEVADFWTREEVFALPDDGQRYELVDGELLVTPSPRPVHQNTVGVFNDRIRPYVKEHQLGTAYSSPADLDLGSGQLVQPDIFVVRTSDGLPPRSWAQVGIPLLIVEVVSASTARQDRGPKRRRYLRSRVPTYWIVDPDARLVEVWTPERPLKTPGRQGAKGSAVRGGEGDTVRVVNETLLWHPRTAPSPLVIDLPATFREIWEG